MTNPFQALVAAPTPPAYWPDERRTRRVLEVEEDDQPFEEQPRKTRATQMEIRAARLAGIERYIRSAPGIVTGAEIARKFGITAHTASKDVVTLRQRGFEVKGVAGVGYTYQGEGCTAPPAAKSAQRQALMDAVQRKARPRTLAAGDRVGEWTLLEYEQGHLVPVRTLPRWKCRCSCGTVRWVSSTNLNAAKKGIKGIGSHSCGHRQGDE